MAIEDIMVTMRCRHRFFKRNGVRMLRLKYYVRGAGVRRAWVEEYTVARGQNRRLVLTRSN